MALKFAPRVSELLQTHLQSNMLRYLIAFFALFLAVFIIGIIANMTVHRLINITGLTIVDRVLGIVFGSARGLIAVGVILMFTSVTPMQNAPWATSSQLAPRFTPLVVWLDGFLPEQLQELSEWLTVKTTEKAAVFEGQTKTTENSTPLPKQQEG